MPHIAADGTCDLTQPGDTEETALVPAMPSCARIVSRLVHPPEYAKAWRLAPDLVAEVVSPTQFRREMAAKAQRYLAGGVRLVWIIWPKSGRWMCGARMMHNPSGDAQYRRRA